jgi:hypothetical protein
MTDHDDHDTEAAPNEQAGPPTTELPSKAKHAETPEAGSLDDDAEADSAAPRHWYLRAGEAILLTVLVAVFLIPPIQMFFTSGSAKQAGPGAKPSTTVAVNAPPSAPTVAPSTAPAVTPTPGFSADDENFLSLMSQEGWGCTDNSGAEQCKKQMVSFAHQICSYSGQPIDLIYQDFGLPAFFGPGEEDRAIANAEQAYPNCTITGSP